jgi:hypothetical protein
MLRLLTGRLLVDVVRSHVVAPNLRSSVRSRARLDLEILALRHQLHVLERSRPRRVRLTPADRVLWVWLSCVSRDWRIVVIVKPDTILAWHRRGFRLVWAWKRRCDGGRGWRRMYLATVDWLTEIPNF